MSPELARTVMRAARRRYEWVYHLDCSGCGRVFEFASRDARDEARAVHRRHGAIDCWRQVKR